MKKILYILSAVAILAGCSKHDVTDDTLPQDTHPMSFTAAVGELEVAPQSAPHSKAATRATDQLPMRISIDNGASYTNYTLSADGSLAPTNVGEELYWTKTTAQVNAYTPATIGSGGINITNQSSGWGMLGYVGVVPAKVHTFRKAPIALTLQPATAKVNINLVAGDGVSEAELSAATVVLSGYTQATMNASTFALEGSGANSAITPKGSNKAFEALLVPQQMQGKRFVRVTIGGLNYYYTPTNSTDANLAAGKQYTFTVTVNKGGITVTASGAQEWTGTTTNVTSYDVFTASDLKIGDYYYSDGNTSDGGLRKRYADGTFVKDDVGPVLTDASNQPRTVIGIVLKVGKDDNGDWLDNCQYTLKGTSTPMSTIKGYVLALYDANNGSTCVWGSDRVAVGTDLGASTKEMSFLGYTNTQKIKQYAETNRLNFNNAFPAAYYATELYESLYIAPQQSSGWFLPSSGQCVIWKQNIDLFLGQIRKASGNNSYDWMRVYWSSSEDKNLPNQAIHPLGIIPYTYWNFKWMSNSVRSCLVF